MDVSTASTIIAGGGGLVGLMVSILVWNYFIREWKPEAPIFEYVRLTLYPMCFYLAFSGLFPAIIGTFFGLPFKKVIDVLLAGVGLYLFSMVVVIIYMMIKKDKLSDKPVESQPRRQMTICTRCGCEYEVTVTSCRECETAEFMKIAP